MPLNALKVEFLHCYGGPMSRRSGAVRPPVFGARFCETSAVTEGNPSPRLKGLQKYDPACAGPAGFAAMGSRFALLHAR